MDTMPAPMSVPMSVQVAKDAENLQDADAPDSFPPEGTDETTLDPDARHVLEQDQRLKATRAVIKAGY